MKQAKQTHEIADKHNAKFTEDIADLGKRLVSLQNGEELVKGIVVRRAVKAHVRFRVDYGL